jgi:hypothetical protein
MSINFSDYALESKKDIIELISNIRSKTNLATGLTVSEAYEALVASSLVLPSSVSVAKNPISQPFSLTNLTLEKKSALEGIANYFRNNTNTTLGSLSVYQMADLAKKLEVATVDPTYISDSNSGNFTIYYTAGDSSESYRFMKVVSDDGNSTEDIDFVNNSSGSKELKCYDHAGEWTIIITWNTTYSGDVSTCNVTITMHSYLLAGISRSASLYQGYSEYNHGAVTVGY